MSDKKDITPKILVRIPKPEECCTGSLTNGAKHCALGWMYEFEGLWDETGSNLDLVAFTKANFYAVEREYLLAYGRMIHEDVDGFYVDVPTALRRIVALFPDRYIAIES